MSKHFQTLKISDIIRETPKTVSIVFEVPDSLREEFKYRAGQYLTIKAMVNGEEVRRSYSLSSSPAEKDLKISSKTVENGKMSNYLDSQIHVGMEMQVMAPEGKFTTESISSDADLILFAAGSGITPVISIIKDSLRNQSQRKIFLFYCNSTEEEIIFKKELQSLAQEFSDRFQLQLFVSRSDVDGPGFLCGRMDDSRIKELLSNVGDYNSKHYFICGPEGMISSTKSSLEALSIPSEQIHIEYFASPKTDEMPIKRNISGDVSEVTVVIDGEEHQITLKPKESILEAAIRLELDPPFSCQSGVCTTCQAKVMEGEVEMENNFGLSDEEVDEGYVLTCISFPKSSGVVVSWDEV